VFATELNTENKKRDQKQIEHSTNEGALADATLENAQFKRDNFQLKNALSRSASKKKLVEAKMKMLTEKVRQMQREQNQAVGPLEAELDRLTADLDARN